MRLSAMALLATLLVAGPLAADTIELENGEKFEVKVVEETASTIVGDHPVFGRVTIPKSALKPPAPVIPGLFGTAILRGWKRSLGAGFSGSRGNSEDASFNTSLRLARVAERYRGTFDSAYFFASKEGDKTSNEFYADYQHDFIIKSSKFFLFGRGRYDYDEFQGWENRIAASAGGGYDFYKLEKFELRGRLGGGFARTFGVEREWRPEGVAGVSLVWRIIEGHTFEANSTYYPNFDDLPEFRLLSNALYSIAVGQIEGLSLKFGLKDDYDSQALGDNNNLKYYGNLVYEF